MIERDKPFDPDSRCVKCGNMSASARYKSLTTTFLGRIDRFERIERTCPRCGFEWNESPLDSIAPPPQREGGDARLDGFEETITGGAG